MLSFNVEIRSGSPIYEQVVFAVKKAIVQGILKAGDRFPSVREISKELNINPNTVQKIISQLVLEKLLAIEPGKGSIVLELPNFSNEQIHEVIEPIIDQLVVEAKKLSIPQTDIMHQIKMHWEHREEKLSNELRD